MRAASRRSKKARSFTKSYYESNRARGTGVRSGFGPGPMIQQTPEAERFKLQMRDSLQHETLNSRAVTNPRHASFHTGGGQRVADRSDVVAVAGIVGKIDPRSIRIELKTFHEELSETVGTMRSRIAFFTHRFRNLAVIETNSDHFLIFKENILTEYLAQIA
jgi:hypothetical protein